MMTRAQADEWDRKKLEAWEAKRRKAVARENADRALAEHERQQLSRDHAEDERQMNGDWSKS